MKLNRKDYLFARRIMFILQIVSIVTYIICWDQIKCNSIARYGVWTLVSVVVIYSIWLTIVFLRNKNNLNEEFKEYNEKKWKEFENSYEEQYYEHLNKLLSYDLQNESNIDEYNKELEKVKELKHLAKMEKKEKKRRNKEEKSKNK